MRINHDRQNTVANTVAIPPRDYYCNRRPHSGVRRSLAGSATIDSELRQKNDQIIALQQQSAGAITGGDSFAEMVLEVRDVTTGAVAMPVLAHHGKFPLYDVTARIADLGEYRKLTAAKNFLAATTALQGTEVSVGNLTPGFARGPMVALQHPSGRDFKLQCFLRRTEWFLDSTVAHEVDGQRMERGHSDIRAERRKGTIPKRDTRLPTRAEPRSRMGG
jgi:hypothetical protein